MNLCRRWCTATLRSRGGIWTPTVLFSIHPREGLDWSSMPRRVKWILLYDASKLFMTSYRRLWCTRRSDISLYYIWKLAATAAFPLFVFFLLGCFLDNKGQYFHNNTAHSYNQKPLPWEWAVLCMTVLHSCYICNMCSTWFFSKVMDRPWTIDMPRIKLEWFSSQINGLLFHRFHDSDVFNQTIFSR